MEHHMPLPQLAPDKAQHFIYGAIASCAVASAVILIGAPPLAGAAAGVACAAAIGFGKERWDRYSGRGTVDLRDAVATIAGGVIAALPCALAGV
jgi:hypothetical protein